MECPTDRKYAETHEWYLKEGDLVTVGITQYAADELTDITFVELPEIGSSHGVGDTIGEVESVKATSDLYTAVAGQVVEVNTALGDHPELLNDDPFEEGWIIRIKADSAAPLGALMSAKEYTSFVRNSS